MAVVTVNATFTMMGLLVAPGELMAMAAVYDPGVKFAGFTEAVIVAGVLVLLVVTLNQEAFDVAASVAELELVTVNACEAGIAVPVW